MSRQENASVDLSQALAAHEDTIREAADTQSAVNLLVAGVLACHAHGIAPGSIIHVAATAAQSADEVTNTSSL